MAITAGLRRRARKILAVLMEQDDADPTLRLVLGSGVVEPDRSPMRGGRSCESVGTVTRVAVTAYRERGLDIAGILYTVVHWYLTRNLTD